MCGIAGIIQLNRQTVVRSDLTAMNRALTHRGPDGDGIFCSGSVGLAHRRLAIIDLAGGTQPMYTHDHKVVIVYNGEIYNYKEVYDELRGVLPFDTVSDTEVILNAYAQWGIASLERMRGMFAFALYDVSQQVVYLVRDRLGIKPLYYYQTPTQLSFASEFNALLQLATVPRQINPTAVAQYFRYQYVPTPDTIYQNVHKLEPGHYLRIDLRTGQVYNQTYWQLKLTCAERNQSDWLAALNSLLDDTIKIYVRSDVPFGAFLSGGVDSSLVTALMAKHLEQPVKTVSIGFQEEHHSELPFARHVSHILRSNHYENIVSAQLAQDILEQIVVHFGEPFADSSAIPTYFVAREAAQHVKMVLSGDGGDELFGGYNSYLATFRDYTGLNKMWPSPVLGMIERFGYPAKVRQWAQRQQLDAQQKHDTYRHIFDDVGLQRLLGRVDAAPPLVRGDFALNDATIDPITLFQAQDVRTYMVDDVLTKVDRMSMAHSLEVRVPLLDHKIVEFAFSLPLSLKLRYEPTSRRIESKYLLKQSARRFFSHEFLNRPKMGFGMPVQEWCYGPFRPLIETSLRNRQNPLFGWVDYRHVAELLNNFFAGNHRLAVKIWFLLMFELWFRTVHLQAKQDTY